MWIFVDLMPKAGLGTLLLCMVLPFALAIGGFVYAAKTKGALRALCLLWGLAWTVGIAWVIGDSVSDIAEKNSFKNPENLIISVSDKENAGDQVFHFPLQVHNCFREKVVHTRMEIVMTNYQGDVLLQADIPSCACAPDETDAFVLEVLVRGDTAQELYYTGYEYLNISVIAHYVQYESGGYDLGTYTIHTIDQAQLAQAYGEAVAAYEAGNYREAWDLFATLGSYEDSENYRNLLIHQNQ